MALFSNRRSTSAFLVEFRAGKMTMRGSTVYPDKRKGLVYIHQSHDSLMHFCWKDRGTGVVEDDLILFPEEVEFINVPQCTTGRVYLLKFRNSSRKLFFWMQEPKSDKDEEYCRKVNELLNKPPPAVSGARKGNGRTSGVFQESFGEQLGIMNQLLNLGSRRDGSGSSGSSDWPGGTVPTMNQSQLMELLDLMGNGSQVMEVSDPEHLLSSLSAGRTRDKPVLRSGSSPEETPVDTSGAAGASADAIPAAVGDAAVGGDDFDPYADEDKSGKIALSDLRSVLASLSTRVKEGECAEVQVNLADVFSPGNLENIVLKEENLKRLCSHLPDEPEHSDKQRLMENLRCPQFRQYLKMFGDTLQCGQLGALLKQFFFPPPVIEACANGDLLAIALCIERAVSLEQRETQTSAGNQDSLSRSLEPAKKKKRDIDSDMDLD